MREAAFFLAFFLSVSCCSYAQKTDSNGSLMNEDGEAGWLRYTTIQDQQILNRYAVFPDNIRVLDNAQLALTAEKELIRGAGSMLKKTLQETTQLSDRNAVVLGTVGELHAEFPGWTANETLTAEGYQLATIHTHHHTYWLVAGVDNQGILYGTFRLLQKVAEQQDISFLDESESPAAKIRWVNQWDNLDGSIERGYAGRSIFFENGGVRADLTRAAEYARLLASVGINGCTVNNVNSDLRMMTPEMIQQLARIGDAFRPWGVKLSIAVDLSSPKVVGGLTTFDPLDPQVVKWWQSKIDALYAQIPDLGGLVIKADSEGRAGPSQYGRTPSEAANALARVLKPHHGVILYRAFVYNHHADWRDLKADRARAAYDIFHPLDGKFDDNVIVQIKHGPIDFQVREPVSPLFAGLPHTNEAIELQITQEYTGQQRHLVFLVPMWKQALDFDLRAENRATPVKEIVEGKTFHRPFGGFVGVANVGLDTNWMFHPLAMANLYGFGRLAWNPDTSADVIAEDWTRMTFGNNAAVVKAVDAMLLSSWSIYEQYTGPLGIGTLTNILHAHYGPGIESAERNGWGQWIRSDHEGIGMDRTVATGTGYIGQYPPEAAKMYESLTTCPDALLLFMHHVPYTQPLHSGSMVIQYVYDSHYTGAEAAAGLVRQWQSLQGLIDKERFNKVLALLQYQSGHAIVWRDAVNDWFYKMSGVADEKGRVGHHPGRIEAESMHLDGYSSVDVVPWEDASGGKAIQCTDKTACSAETTLEKASGVYSIAVQYFDLHQGASTYKVSVNGNIAGQWAADNTLPFNQIGGDTSTRYTLHDIRLKPGDVLKIEGQPNGNEPAPLDYVEISPETKASDSAAAVHP